MKILKLSAENIKRVRVVEITPEGNLVIVAGRNGQGKTSVLDSIMYALGGADKLPEKPLRRGEEKGVVKVELPGGLVVKRTFTSGGGTALTVTKEGVKQTSPQTLLDELTGKLSFDPLAFASQNPKERSETLRALVGLDFSAAVAERQKLFEQRTRVNGQVAELQARFDSTPLYPEAPKERIDLGQIIEEQKEAANFNRSHDRVRLNALEARRLANGLDVQVTGARKTCSSIEGQIAALQNNLAVEKVELERAIVSANRQKAEADRMEKEIQGLKDADLDIFAARLKEAEATNHKIQANANRLALRDNMRLKQDESQSLSRQIEGVDKARRDKIKAAKYPVEGISIGELGEVLFNGLPFEQASTAEQLRISVAIGLALNPKLRVLLVRRGSDLDSDNLKMVAEMAAAADAQVWLERVEQDGQVSVVIEDGYAHVPAAPPAEPEQPEQPQQPAGQLL